MDSDKVSVRLEDLQFIGSLCDVSGFLLSQASSGELTDDEIRIIVNTIIQWMAYIAGRIHDSTRGYTH